MIEQHNPELAYYRALILKHYGSNSVTMRDIVVEVKANNHFNLSDVEQAEIVLTLANCLITDKQ